MDMLGITGVQALLLIGGVTGFVELVKKLFDKDWKAAIIIFGAGLIGGLISLFPEIDFTFLTGVIGGLTASGVVTVSQNIARKTDGVTIADTVQVEETKTAKRK